MGNPAPRNQSVENKAHKEVMEHHHDVINPAAGMSAKTSIDYRFEASDCKQIRDGAYPLHMAVAAGAPLSVIEMLVKLGGGILLKPNKFGETPLHIALLSHSSDNVIETLIRFGPNSLQMRDNKSANLPIHIAARSGCSVRVAKAMLKEWPELILERNEVNLTPNELAVQSGNCSEDVLRLFKMTAEAI